MRRLKRHSAPGFSLVELLVVLAVIGIIGGISIPIVRMFSQNDLQRGVRELHTVLRAARVYAATYNVNTAVIYQLNTGVMDDTVRRQTVRCLQAAAVVYQLPADMGLHKGKYVPVPKFGAEFRPFPQGHAVLLDTVPDQTGGPPGLPVYARMEGGEFYVGENAETVNIQNSLGMTSVPVYLGHISPDARDWEAEYDETASVRYLGHVFNSAGQLSSGGEAQRYRMLFAPAPDRPREERMWSTVPLTEDDVLVKWLSGDMPGGVMGMLGVPIEIFRSTGRVNMGSL